MTPETKLKWAVGSNGNYFADLGDTRWCVWYENANAYHVAANGKDFEPVFTNADEAKAFAENQLS
jgi:hypothetical protein